MDVAGSLFIHSCSRVVISFHLDCLSFALWCVAFSLRKRVYLFCKDSINVSVHNEMIEANLPKDSDYSE